MLFSSSTFVPQQKLGTIEGIKAMIDAGFPALDMSFFASSWLFTYEGDKLAVAKELRALADDRGVIFNQAHAPFGPTDVFYEKYFPKFAEMFECCSVLGVQNVIVHPLQHLRYYGNEEALFDINMEFYTSIKHFAEKTGILIALENMWQRHPQNNHVVDSVCADPKELCHILLLQPPHFYHSLDACRLFEHIHKKISPFPEKINRKDLVGVLG